MYTWMLLNM